MTPWLPALPHPRPRNPGHGHWESHATDSSWNVAYSVSQSKIPSNWITQTLFSPLPSHFRTMLQTALEWRHSRPFAITTEFGVSRPNGGLLMWLWGVVCRLKLPRSGGMLILKKLTWHKHSLAVVNTAFIQDIEQKIVNKQPGVSMSQFLLIVY